MISDLKAVWFLFTPRERRKASFMLVLVILMAGAETLGVLSIMPFLTVVSRPEVMHENELLQAAYRWLGFENEREFAIALGLLSILTVVLSSAFKTVTLHLINRFVHLQRHSISARLLSRYLHQPYEFFLTRNPAILGKNVLSEIDQLLVNLIKPLSQMVAQGAVVVAMTLLIFYYDPLTAASIVAVIGLLYGAIYASVRNRLARISVERQQASGDRHQACAEALGGIKDVQASHSAPAYQRKFDAASRTYARHLAASDTLSQSPLYLVEAIGYSMLITVALVLLMRSGDVGLVLPALGLYGFAAFRMLPAAQIIYRGAAKLKFSTAALDSLRRDLELPQSAPPPASAPLVPQREIRLSDVSYAYPSAPERLVLDGFSLVVPANESIGLAGRSGAGKSTIMDILLGLLRPHSGTLSVDGVPIDAENLPAWQRAIGFVPQHIYLADASIAENIAFGVDTAAIDMQAVERAARAAQIHDFVVAELPRAYDTEVGDRGIRLSGGQRQRLGIARALYRDPPVLFFDEATSALDGETEEAVNEAIRTLSGQKTIVVIAHKESSLRYCQRVVNL